MLSFGRVFSFFSSVDERLCRSISKLSAGKKRTFEFAARWLHSRSAVTGQRSWTRRGIAESHVDRRSVRRDGGTGTDGTYGKGAAHKPTFDDVLFFLFHLRRLLDKVRESFRHLQEKSLDLVAAIHPRELPHVQVQDVESDHLAVE